MDGLSWALLGAAFIALAVVGFAVTRSRGAGAGRTRPSGFSAPDSPDPAGEPRQAPIRAPEADTPSRRWPESRQDVGTQPGAGGVPPGGTTYDERHRAHWQDGRPEAPPVGTDPTAEALDPRAIAARERIEGRHRGRGPQDG